jgi:hypothetical protein
MTVDLAELREATNRLFDHLQRQGHTTLELTDDYYWSIPREQLYDPLHTPDPSTFGLGQLTDDWTWTQNLLDPAHEPIGAAFEWVAAVLRWVGGRVVR